MFKSIQQFFARRSDARTFRAAAEYVDAYSEYACIAIGCVGTNKNVTRCRREFGALFVAPHFTFGTAHHYLFGERARTSELRQIRVLALLLAAEIAEHGDFVEDVAK